MKIILVFLTVFLCLQENLFAKEFSSGSNQVQLIELFSSEGCSSCPPAEKQLARLTDHNNLWKTFVPINFHVDYWNRLGWTDPYSNSEFTVRQRNFANLWGVGSVYTPAFVLNAESLGPILNFKVLDKQINLKNFIKLNLKVDATKTSYFAKLTAAGLDIKKTYEVHFVLLGNGLVSDVTSGENKGKKLTQNFVALKYQNKIILEKSVSIEIEKPDNSKVSKYGIAAWITEKDQMLPLQALGGYL